MSSILIFFITPALLGPDLGAASSLCSQQSILEQINSRSQSAASVICMMLEEERRRLDIVGVVALMGTLESIELSRSLLVHFMNSTPVEYKLKFNGLKQVSLS